MEKLQNYLYENYNKVVILVLVCIMTLGTAIYLTFPKARALLTYNEIISAAGGTEAVEKQNKSADDLFDTSSNTGDNTANIVDTDEYKEKEFQIQWMQNRIAQLDNKVTFIICTNVTDFFSAYEAYSQIPNPANLEKIKAYMTDEYYNEFKTQKTKEGVYLLDSIWYADLDKKTVAVCTQLKDGRYILFDYVNDEQKGWQINGMTEL